MSYRARDERDAEERRLEALDRFVERASAPDEISEEMWERILRGCRHRSKLLTERAQVEWAGKHARHCAGCANTHIEGGKSGWCRAQRHMVSDIFPVLCRDYVEPKK